MTTKDYNRPKISLPIATTINMPTSTRPTLVTFMRMATAHISHGWAGRTEFFGAMHRAPGSEKAAAVHGKGGTGLMWIRHMIQAG